jgi:hypothetical protein
MAAEAKVVFLSDGTCPWGDRVGAFKVLDDSTIRTYIGDSMEVIAVEVSGDTLTMRTAGELVTVLGQVNK